MHHNSPYLLIKGSRIQQLALLTIHAIPKRASFVMDTSLHGLIQTSDFLCGSFPLQLNYFNLLVSFPSLKVLFSGGPLTMQINSCSLAAE